MKIEMKEIPVRDLVKEYIDTVDDGVIGYEGFEKQKGVCTKCEEVFELKEMEADHITPWSEGGKTSSDNLQMLCKRCNREKSNK